ncbi:MAG: YidC/Oxa1 family membrane protein insertase, partial [Psychroserpens sp.]
MEEKKFDTKSIIGFVLIFAILIFMMWERQPTPEELAEQEKQEQIEADKKAEIKQVKETKVVTGADFTAPKPGDSLKLADLKNKLGSFAYSSTLPSATDAHTVVQTDVFDLKFSNKGGFLSEVILRDFVDYDSIPIALIQNGNESFNITFPTADNRILNTQDQYFEPTITKNGQNTVVSMKFKASETQFLEYRYELKPDEYMIGFSIRSEGLNNVVNSSQAIDLDWGLKTYRHDQSITYENRYTRLTYMSEGDKIDKLGQTGEDEEVLDDARWLS